MYKFKDFAEKHVYIPQIKHPLQEMLREEGVQQTITFIID